MKINMVTLQEGRNYGAVLQAFASVKFFELHGCKVNILNTVRKEARIWASLRNSFRGSILKMPIRVLFAAASLCRANKVFNGFRYKFIKISPEHQYTDIKDIDDYSRDADAFCSGSDQAWNFEHHRKIYPQFYLAFAPAGSYKFSFSSSFGRDRALPEEVSETQKYINEYRHISVREASGVDILREQYHYENAINIQDPTLCINRETWREYAKYSDVCRGGGTKKILYSNILFIF